MRKQIHRALGFAAGAGLQSAPQAIMYTAVTPEDLDHALSSNYHPDNARVIRTMAMAFGMQSIEMKPDNDSKKTTKNAK